MKATATLVFLLFIAASLLASDHKARGRSAWAWAAAQPASESVSVKQNAITETQPDALAEVNEARAKRGLPALVNDPLLTQAAIKAAQQRASRGISGHLPESDFTCLPAGAKADSAGCAALEPSWGWQSCCWDDPQYTHAGAAWVMGSDGLRYNHIFVRTEAIVHKQTAIEPPAPTGEVIYSTGSCASGQCSSSASVTRFSRGRRGR